VSRWDWEQRDEDFELPGWFWPAMVVVCVGLWAWLLLEPDDGTQQLRHSRPGQLDAVAVLECPVTLPAGPGTGG